MCRFVTRMEMLSVTAISLMDLIIILAQSSVAERLFLFKDEPIIVVTNANAFSVLGVLHYV